jgi:hypothetical protein
MAERWYARIHHTDTLWQESHLDEARSRCPLVHRPCHAPSLGRSAPSLDSALATPTAAPCEHRGQFPAPRYPAASAALLNATRL